MKKYENMDIGLEKEHQQYLGYLTFLQQKFNYKQGWIALRFKQNYGFYPPWDYIYEPLDPPENLVKQLQPKTLSHQIDLGKAIEYEDSQSAINRLEHPNLPLSEFTFKKHRKIKKEKLPPKIY